MQWFLCTTHRCNFSKYCLNAKSKKVQLRVTGGAKRSPVHAYGMARSGSTRKELHRASNTAPVQVFQSKSCARSRCEHRPAPPPKDNI